VATSEKGRRDISISDDILQKVTQAIDHYRRELDRDQGLRQVRVVVRRINGGDDWAVHIDRSSERVTPVMSSTR
jgi:hypothetical protein